MEGYVTLSETVRLQQRGAHPVGRRAHLGQPLGRPPLGSQLRNAGFDNASHFIGFTETLEAGTDGKTIEPLERLAIERLGSGDLALLGLDEPDARQLPKGLARDGLGDAEVFGNLPLG